MPTTSDKIRQTRLAAFFSDENAERLKQELELEAKRQQAEAERRQKEREAKARWENVESANQSTESVRPAQPAAAPTTTPQGDWLQSTISALLGGPTAGVLPEGNIRRSISNDAAANLREIGSGLAGVAGDMAQSGTLYGPEGALYAGVTANNPIAQAQRQQQVDAAELARQVLTQGSNINRQTAATAREPLSDTAAFFTEAGGSLTNPTTVASFVPVLGVPLAGGLGFLQSYGNARGAGVDGLEAYSVAASDAAWEAAGAKLGNKLTPGISSLRGTGARTVGRLAGDMLGEGIGEGTSQLGQSLTYQGLDALDIGSKELQTYAGQQGADMWRNVALATVGGMGAAGAIKAPAVAQQVAVEAGQRAYERNKILADTKNRLSSERPTIGTVEVGPIDTATISKDASVEAAYVQKQIQDIKAKSTTYTLADDVNEINKLQTRLKELTNPVAQPVVQPVPNAPLEAAAAEQAATEDSTNIPTSELSKLLTTPNKKPQVSETTFEDVVAALRQKDGSQTSNVLTRLLSSGQVKLVNDATQIPTNAEQVSAAGWYDGENTYVVANKLSKNNLVADLVSTTAHEVKHGVDASGWNGTLGVKNNAAIIKQGLALVEQGDAKAKLALQQATGTERANVPMDETQKREFVSYLINNAMEERTGGWASIKRTALGGLRDSARKVGFGKDTINLKDLRYLSDKMLFEVADQGANLQGQLPEGSDNGQSMFAGVGALTKDSASYANAVERVANGENAEQVRQETGWQQGQDNKWRFEIADNEADILPTFYNLKPNSSQANLGDVLKHSKLFAAYPWLKYVKVTAMPGERNTIYGWAGVDKDGNPTINITPNSPKKLSTLLHEVQHIIQEFELFAGGGNRSTVLESMTDDQLRQEIPALISSTESDLALEVARARVYAYAEKAGKWGVQQIQDMRKREKFLYEAYKKASDSISNDVSDDELVATRTAWLDFATRMDSVRDRAMADIGQGLTPRQLMTARQAFGILAASDMSYSDVVRAHSDFNQSVQKGEERIALLKSGDMSAARKALEESQALYAFYRRLTGEVEARLTEERQGMSDEKRKEISPLQTRIDANEVMPEDEIVVPRVNRSSSGMAQILTPEDRAAALGVKTKDPSTKMGRMEMALKRSLFGDMGVGAQLDEQRLHAGAYSAALAVRAEQVRYELANAIENTYRGMGISRDDLVAKVDEVLAKADASDDPDVRTSAVAALDRMYPGYNLGTAFNNLRALKWEYAQKIIELRVEDGRPLTQKEFNAYAKIVDNAERWTTRAYQSMLAGRDDYAKNFIKRSKDASTKEAQQLAEALSYIETEWLSVPDGKELESLPTKDLEKLYKAWDLQGRTTLREDPVERREDMINALSFLDEADGDAFRKQAMTIAEDMIGLNKKETGAGRMLRGMRQNRTVLEARTDIPKAIRAIMGEITDPYLREAVSVARLTQLVATTKNLTDIYQQGNGVWWSDKSDDRFTKRIDGASFGPLNGKHVTQDLYDTLGAYVKYNESFESQLKDALEQPAGALKVVADRAMKPVRGVAKAYKFAQVMGSTANFAINFAGSNLTLVKNGVTPANAARGLRDAMRLFTTTKLRNASDETMAINQEILMAGVTDSAQVQEHRSESWKQLNNEIRDLNETNAIKKLMNSVRNKIAAGVELVGDIYAFMDVWTKVATYYQNKDVLAAYAKAEGLDWTDEQLIRQAGYLTTLSTISYNRAPPAVKAIERNLPFLGGFLTYKMEAWRSVGGGLQAAAYYNQLAQNAKTEDGKAAAASRVRAQIGGTLAATLGVIGGVSALLMKEDEEDQKKRALYPEWERSNIHVYLGKDQQGREHYQSINRFDTIGPVNDPFIRLIDGINKDRGAGEITAAALSDFITTFRVYSDIMEGFADIYRASSGGGRSKPPRETFLDRAFPSEMQQAKGLTPSTDLVGNTAAVLSNFVPSQVAGWFDPERLNISEGPAAGAPAKTMLIAGVKPMVVDPVKSLGYRVSDYNTAMQELNRQKKSLLESASSPEQVMSGIQDLLEGEREATNKLREATGAFLYYNQPSMLAGEKLDSGKKLTASQARDIFKERRLNKTAISNVLGGTNKSSVVDGKLIEEWYKAQVSNIDKRDPDYRTKVEDAKNKAKLLRLALQAQEGDK